MPSSVRLTEDEICTFAFISSTAAGPWGNRKPDDVPRTFSFPAMILAVRPRFAIVMTNLLSAGRPVASTEGRGQMCRCVGESVLLYEPGNGSSGVILGWSPHQYCSSYDFNLKRFEKLVRY